MKKQTKQVKKTNKKHESGRSMIEMVGVLAVMGLITAGAFVLISSAMSSQRISRVDDDVSALVQGVRMLYNTNNNFNGLTDDAKNVLGFKDVKNPFGGTYTLSTTDTDDTPAKNATFTIVIDNLGKTNAGVLEARKWPGGGDAACGTVSTNNNTTTFTSAACDSANAISITYGKDEGIKL